MLNILTGLFCIFIGLGVCNHYRNVEFVRAAMRSAIDDQKDAILEAIRDATHPFAIQVPDDVEQETGLSFYNEGCLQAFLEGLHTSYTMTWGVSFASKEKFLKEFLSNQRTKYQLRYEAEQTVFNDGAREAYANWLSDKDLWSNKALVSK